MGVVATTADIWMEAFGGYSGILTGTKAGVLRQKRVRVFVVPKLKGPMHLISKRNILAWDKI